MKSSPRIQVSPSDEAPAHEDARLGALLARGLNADVYEWSGPRPGAVGSSTLVVKIHRGSGGPLRAHAEALALSSAEHRHVVTLVELVSIPGADSLGLVLPRLTEVSASGLLASRGVLSAGEAVTLLIPTLAALQHLARCPLSRHADLVSGIRLDDVLLDRHGAPVVTGVRAGAEHGPERLRRLPGGAGGTASRMVEAVLARSSGGDVAARRRIMRLVDDGGAEIDELVESLFDLAPPSPLDDDSPFEQPDTPTDDQPPSRHILDDLVPGFAALRDSANRSPQYMALMSRVGFVAQAARQIRPRVWLLAGAVIGCAAIGAVSSGGSEPRESAPRQSAAGSRPLGQSSPPAEQDPSPGPSVARTSGVLTGDDADAAARLLLALREACLSALDEDCLTGVDEGGSAALADDVRGLADPEGLAALPRPTIEIAVNRLGGVVLYRAVEGDGRTASVFVVKTEAGWRLRALS